MARFCLGTTGHRPADKTALIVVHDAQAPLEDAEHWRYGELDEAVRRIAAGLLALGLNPGDRLMIRRPSTTDYALLFFGGIAAGLVVLPSSDQLTAGEAAFLARDADVRAVAVTEALAFDAGSALIIDEAMLATLKAHAPLSDYADTAAEDPAFLVYTSGTSGRPKGVLHAQRSAWGRRPMVAGWYGLTADDVMLHAGAFNWTYTLGVGLTDPWANGAATAVFSGTREPAVWPQLMRLTGATLFAAVPSVYRQILKYADVSATDALGTLRHGLTAGEALTPELLAAWREATGRDLYEALGMSECSTYVSTAPGMAIKPGSPGRPQPGRSVAVLGEEEGEEPLPAGKTGLLAVHRSDPGLMLGYWRRPEDDVQVYRGEWFVGGDLAHFDEEGYLWYEGRADDVMNALGYRVAPAEIEAILSEHEAVAEVAVAERKVRSDLSIVAAYVVPVEGAHPDADDLIAFATDRLARYKCPREIVFVDALPRTGNGKVMRRSLNDLGREEA